MNPLPDADFDEPFLSSTIEVMYIAVHRSKDALVALSFFLVMALVVFSTLIYFAERGTWDSTLETFISADGERGESCTKKTPLMSNHNLGNPSDFVSIPAAAWFVLVSESSFDWPFKG